MAETGGFNMTDNYYMEGPIKTVTVSEDEANICREGTVTWEKGPVNIFIRNVSPCLIDQSLWAEVQCKDIETHLEIGSVRAVRNIIKEETLQEKKILENLETLSKELFSLKHKKERLDLYRYTVEKAFAPTIEEILEKILLDGSMPESYTPQIDMILEEIYRYYLENFAITEEQKLCYRKLKKYENEMAFNPSLLHKQGGILISMEANKEGVGLLRCGYKLPCTQWRPQHEAHMTDEEKILFITHGVVWQNTGEDWNDVELILSTARPSLGLNIVNPGTDELHLRKKTPYERKKIEVMVRDYTVSKTSISMSSEPPVPSDGGETQFYRVPEKVKIPSGRKPHIIEVNKIEFTGKKEIIAVPELDNKLYLRSLVKNTGTVPVLAGPISLHREKAFVGKGDLNFTPSGADFYLWWGSEDLVRLERYAEIKDEQATLLQKRKVHYNVNLYIINLTGQTVSFKIQERIPVSELEQIYISVAELPEGAEKPDKNGFIFIDVTMAPDEEKKLSLSYIVELDKEVVYRPHDVHMGKVVTC